MYDSIKGSYSPYFAEIQKSSKKLKSKQVSHRVTPINSVSTRDEIKIKRKKKKENISKVIKTKKKRQASKIN